MCFNITCLDHTLPQIDRLNEKLTYNPLPRVLSVTM